MSAKEPTPPQDGRCCSCGYEGSAETPCPARSDGSHCKHWWDAPLTAAFVRSLRGKKAKA